MPKFKRCSKGSKCIHPESDDGWLPATLDYFYADKNATTGLRPPCKACFNQCVKNTQDMTRKNEAVKRYAETHPEIRAKIKQNFKERHPGKAAEYCRDWYWRNADQERERTRKYKNDHHEEVLKQTRQHRKTHREPSRLQCRRYLARKKNLPDTLTLEEWEYALDYFGHRCAVCGRPEGDGYHLAADHWIPLNSRDCPGTVAVNIVPLCHSITRGVYGACNNSKSAKRPQKWLPERFGVERAEEVLARIETYFDHLRSLEMG